MKLKENIESSPSSSLIPEAMNWMFEMGLVDDKAILDNAVLLCFMAHKKIRNVSFELDPKTKDLIINLFLSRLAMMISSKKKIETRVLSLLGPFSDHYRIKIQFRVWSRNGA